MFMAKTMLKDMNRVSVKTFALQTNKNSMTCDHRFHKHSKNRMC